MSQLEQWRPVPGVFGSHYAVSDQGRVRRQVSGQHTRAGRVLKPYPSPAGLQVRLTKMVTIGLWYGQVATHALVHRLVWGAHVGPLARGVDVLPRNGDKHDARLRNLVARPRRQAAA